MGDVGLESELERDAAPDQAREHQHKRDVEGAQKHRISQRKCREQTCAAEDEPGLVPVPDRRNSVHHRVAILNAGTNGSRIPMPRSKPSMTTYIIRPKPMMSAQRTGRSTPIVVSP